MQKNKSILITGGTGSFGKKAVKMILQEYQPRRLVIFSRDELKQFEMAQKYPEQDFHSIRFFIGDVRDGDRLKRAMEGIDTVVHAAALKHKDVFHVDVFIFHIGHFADAQNFSRSVVQPAHLYHNVDG